MSGNIVLTNSSPENILQRGIGRLLLSAASMKIMCAVAIVTFYEKKGAKNHTSHKRQNENESTKQ